MIKKEHLWFKLQHLITPKMKNAQIAGLSTFIAKLQILPLCIKRTKKNVNYLTCRLLHLLPFNPVGTNSAVPHS